MDARLEGVDYGMRLSGMRLRYERNEYQGMSGLSVRQERNAVRLESPLSGLAHHRQELEGVYYGG